MAITGLPLDQAKALLDSHGGNINAAAEAHFSVRSDGTNTVDHPKNEGSSASDDPEEVVAQLFEGAKARSKNIRFLVPAERWEAVLNVILVKVPGRYTAHF